LSKGLPIREWRPHGLAERWGLAENAASALKMAGFEKIGSALEQLGEASRAHVLDGMLVLWHP